MRPTTSLPPTPPPTATRGRGRRGTSTSPTREARPRRSWSPTSTCRSGRTVTEYLPSVEIAAGAPITSAVIWLHGLGADGHDFEPIVPALGLRALGVRFVLPHAPPRPVSVNMGLIMRAWFDIRGLDFQGDVDEKGIKESIAQVEAL